MRALIVSLTLFACPAFSQAVRIVKFDAVQNLIEQPASDKSFQIINFWATWCAPCVKELPYLEALQANRENKVSVILISLDFADQVNKVNAFVKRKGIKSDVWLLDEIDYNSWIDKVDKSWSGAIPATLIINLTTGKRKFIEKELQEGDLEKVLLELNN